MRLDTKIRDGIIEVLAIAAQADYEESIGLKQTAESVAGLRTRALSRYSCAWTPVRPLDEYGSGDVTFHAKVRRTAAAIFHVIEGEESDEIHRRHNESIGIN